MKKLLSISAMVLIVLTGVAHCSNTQGHAEIQKIVERHSVFQNVPITAVDKYSVVLKTPTGFATGIYDDDSKRIFVAKIHSREAFRHVVMHEASHFIWFKANPALQWQFCRAFDMHGVSVSRYGRTSCSENFAEISARINGSAYRNYTLPENYLETSDQYRLAHLILNQWMSN
jgi:hypothetical protein